MKILTKAEEERLRWEIECEIRKELREEYKRKNREYAHNIIYDAVGKLNDLSNDIAVSIKVETDSAGVIQMIIAKLKASVANSLFKEARKSLLERL